VELNIWILKGISVQTEYCVYIVRTTTLSETNLEVLLLAQ